MGFFSKLKSAVGIGNPKIEVQLESNQVKRGDSIRGTISITGASGEVPVTALLLEFVEIITEERWSETTKKYEKHDVEKTLGKVNLPKGGYKIKEGETISDKFEIAVSTGAYISAYPTSHKIKASADVPGLDPRSKQEIFIL